MRTVALLLLVTACGGSVASTTDAGTDATSSDASDAKADVVADAGSDPFCQGDKPKMLENGKDNPILQVTGKAIIMNCCNAAAVTLSTAQHAALFTLRWQQYGAGPSPVLLGDKDTTAELALGCDPTTTACTKTNSVEYFAQGFAGTIKYEYVGQKMLVSYCVSVTETPSEPHTIVKSLKLYVPNLDSP